MAIAESPEAKGTSVPNSSYDISKVQSIKTEKTFMDFAVRGNVEEEKKIESTIYDQHYSERETKRLVKKAGTTDGSPSKVLNEDIPVDIKKTRRVKKAGNRDSSRLDKAHRA